MANMVSQTLNNQNIFMANIKCIGMKNLMKLVQWDLTADKSALSQIMASKQHANVDQYHCCIFNIQLVYKLCLNQWCLLKIEALGMNFIEILMEIQVISLNKLYLKMKSAKRRSFYHGFNVLGP